MEAKEDRERVESSLKSTVRLVVIPASLGVGPLRVQRLTRELGLTPQGSAYANG